MAVNFQQQLFKWNHAAEFRQVLLDVQHKPQQTSNIHNVFVDLFKKISLASFVCSMFAADINLKNKINTKECLKLMWSLHVVASCSDDFRFFLWLNLKHLRAHVLPHYSTISSCLCRKIPAPSCSRGTSWSIPGTSSSLTSPSTTERGTAFPTSLTWPAEVGVSPPVILIFCVLETNSMWPQQLMNSLFFCIVKMLKPVGWKLIL